MISMRLIKFVVALLFVGPTLHAQQVDITTRWTQRGMNGQEAQALTLNANFTTEGFVGEMMRTQTTNPYSVHVKRSGIGLGSAWGLTWILGLAMGDEYVSTTFLPVIGPWITMRRIERDRKTEPIDYLPGGKPLLITSGLIQGGLLAYFVWSIVNNGSFSDDLSLSPVFDSRGSGMALTYRF